MGRRLILTIPAMVFVAVVGAACWVNFVSPLAVDFVSFWAAARLAIQGQAAAAYDVVAHHAMEASATTIDGRLLPFPYAPPFLFFLAPIGLLPYRVAFSVWVVVTGLIYVLAAPIPKRTLLGYPVFVSNGLVGQTGYLTTALFLFGTRLIQSRPLLGGAILGLMVIKPQLALLLPVALIAGRHWRAIFYAALSSISLLVLALIVFGLEAHQGFVQMFPRYASYLGESRWPWSELASPFAFVRWFGASQATAWVVHGGIAVLASIMVWRAWRLDWEAKIPILAAATLLIPPYIFSYDALLLVVPFAWLIERNRLHAASIWALSLLPVISVVSGLDTGPNTLAIAAVMSLVALYPRSGGTLPTVSAFTSSQRHLP